MENPTFVTFRLLNQTKSKMKLKLSVDENNQSDILICGCYPQVIGTLDKFMTTEFKLELLPLTCGVGQISGLNVVDVISDIRWEFAKPFAKFTVDFA